MIKSLIASIVLLCLPGMAAHGEEQQINVSLSTIKTEEYKQVTTSATTGAATLLDDDETRIRMGEDAVEHARAFSWSATAAQLSSLYNDAVTAEMNEATPRRADGARW